jgi:DNA-binding transcriptional LysR family regulator
MVHISSNSNNVDALLQMVIHGKAITIGTEYIVRSLPTQIKKEIKTI